MAAKRPRALSRSAKTVTPERARRLHRLLRMLGTGPQTREAISRKLRLDIRGFYRDLGLLREAGIVIRPVAGRYRLVLEVDDALARLPFPDPCLTLGEASQLATGRQPVHRKLMGQLRKITR